MERHWHQRGGRRHERDLDHRGCLAYWRATLVSLGGALNVEIWRHRRSYFRDTRALGCRLVLRF